MSSSPSNDRDVPLTLKLTINGVLNWPAAQCSNAADSSLYRTGYSTRKNRMTTSFGYRSPIPTKSDFVIHCSSGAEVSNFGCVRK